MGIDRSSLNAILISCRHIKNKQNLLTLGRQQIHTSHQNNIDIGDVSSYVKEHPFDSIYFSFE